MFMFFAPDMRTETLRNVSTEILLLLRAIKGDKKKSFFEFFTTHNGALTIEF